MIFFKSWYGSVKAEIFRANRLYFETSHISVIFICVKAPVFIILNWTNFFVYKTQPTFSTTFGNKIETSKH